MGLAAPESTIEGLDRLSVDPFLENAGQLDPPDVRFYFGSSRYQVGFAKGAVLFQLVEAPSASTRKDSAWNPTYPAESPPNSGTARGVLLRLTFGGANDVDPEGRDPLPYPSHFFLGSDPAGWRTNVRGYREVVYESLYEGVDLVYRATTRGVKYEFHLGAGVNPAIIAMTYEGADGLAVRGNGELSVLTAAGELVDSALVAFQGQDPIPCAFALRSRSSYGYDCDEVDATRTLVIDPLLYSTYLGGGGDDAGYSIAVDAAGNAYVAGHTWSADFPATPGAFNTTLEGSSDAFVAKLAPTGANLTYATFLGGSSEDRGLAITVDAAGNVWVAGTTFSTDFPVTPGARDESYNGDWDAFAAKLDPTGAVLAYATYLGGGRAEECRSIAVDDAGNATATGYTNSVDFPVTPGAFDTSYVDPWGFVDVFLVRLDPSGSSLVYSTYLGGGGRDVGIAVAVDDAGYATVTGYTNSTNFPTTPGANDTTYNGGGLFGDAFVARLDPAGANLAYGTFLGGLSEDQASSVAVDVAGAAYVTGITQSLGFPVTPGSMDSSLGGPEDAFVAKLDAAGAVVLYATYLGGAGRETYASWITVDTAGNALVAGLTNSTDFPVTSGASDATYNGGTPSGGDVFVAKLDAAGTSLLYATYLGGSDDDVPYATSLGASGAVYVVGATSSADFPTTPGAFDGNFSDGGRDAFVARLTPQPSAPDLAVVSGDVRPVPPGPVITGTLVTIDVTIRNVGDRDASSVPVRYFDGPPSGGNQIAADQFLPFIPATGGTGLVSVSWTAGSPGVHDICVVADPDDTIAEGDETNNEACAPVEVLPSLADLSVVPGEIVLSPASPYTEGDSVRLNATVRNVGTNDSAATVARIHRGLPPSPQIGTDQAVLQLPAGGSTSVSVSWIASPTGSHDLCVVLDPDDLVPESEETNNLACVTLLVDLPPPDYVPSNPQIASATMGLLLPVALSLEVWNGGIGPGPRAATLALYNESTPGAPFATFSVAPLGAQTSSGPLVAMWSAPATAGVYRVFADVDYGDVLRETDETNNLFAWTINVVPPPITLLQVGQPNYTAAATYVTSLTSLRLTVLDPSSTGIRSTRYRIDTDPWNDYSGAFGLAGEGEHMIEWSSEDNAGNVELAQSTSLWVDNSPPETTLLREESGVTVDSHFTLSALDTGAGIAGTWYRVDDGSWSPYSEAFSLPAGEHTVGYRSTDHVGNQEPERNFAVTVVLSPPVVWQGALFWWLLVVLAAGIAVVGLRRRETVLARFLLPFVPLWARLRREDILDNEKRVLVRGYLAANPGANFASIRADLRLGVGTLAYHLWVLETEGIIKSWRDGRLRRYAPSEHRMAAMQPRLTDIELFLLQSIRRSPEITQRELAEEVGVSQPAISYHITKMTELGIVRVERRGLRRSYSVDLASASSAREQGTRGFSKNDRT